MAHFYRVTIFGRAASPWRGGLRLAQQDAVDLGLGEFDEWGTFYVNVPGEIESAHEYELARRAASAA